jgi:hypothetical protein
MMTLADSEPGISEVLQGNRAPSGILFPPWFEEESTKKPCVNTGLLNIGLAQNALRPRGRGQGAIFNTSA